MIDCMNQNKPLSDSPMKIFTYLSPNFLELGIAIFNRIQNEVGELEIAVISAGGPTVTERLAKETNLNVSSVTVLDELENNLLKQTDYMGRLKKLETRIGARALNEILIADRRIGYGYVYGADMPSTPLIEMSADNEMVRKLLTGTTDFVVDTFDNFKPDAVITLSIASGITRALSAICSHHDLPFLTLGATRIEDLYIVDNDPECKLAPVRDEFQISLNDPSRLGHHYEEAAQFIDKFRNRPIAPEYNISYRNKFHSRVSALGAVTQITQGMGSLLRSLTQPSPRNDLRTPSLMGRAWWRGKVALREIYRLRYGPFLPKGKVPAAPYAYFPLHVTPEASTMVWSPMFTDQIATIEALSKSLPPTMNLVIKEHLPMVGHRPNEFYERLRRMPKVVLVSPFESSFELIAKADLVAVITGTAGWEAILMGVPALILGRVSYTDFGDGFVYCSDFANLPDAVEEALQLEPASDERLKQFIGTIFRISFRLPNELLWSHPSKARVAELASEINAIADRVLALIPRASQQSTPVSVDEDEVVLQR